MTVDTASESDGVMRGLRLFGAFIGLILVSVGTWFAVTLFLALGKAVSEPASIHDRLDKWEAVVRGRLPDMLHSGEPASLAQQQAEGDPPPSAARETITPRDLAEYIAVSSRPVAILFLIAVIGLLIRIAVSLIDAGARLLGLASHEAAIMKRILAELRRQR
ncbi:MAG: hypothetical protein N2111_11755 [Candidatus Sumerlaeaceae bacterium]|nr:hypothetical protein [Candidatus Sumerlaeaceae bacterium]